MDLNWNTTCRTCLSENESMLSLFDIYEHDLTLAMILQTCTNIEVYEGDGLPLNLCDNCILVITQFYNFVIVYEESVKQLRKFVKNAVQPTEVSEEEIQEKIIYQDCNTNETKFLDNIIAVEVNREEVLSGCNTEILDDNFAEQEEEDDLKEGILPKDEIEIGDDIENTLPPNNLVVTVKNKHKEDDDVVYEEITRYECSICGDTHLYSNSFLQHMRSKHKMFDVNCKSYAKQTQIKICQNYKRKNLQRASTIMSEENFNDKVIISRCKYCNKEFEYVFQLREHMKLHEELKKYVCEVCGASFIRKTYLDDHMEGHSTEKKHKCKFCGKAFRRRTVLRAHKRVHTHPNYYVCEECGKAFTNNSTLKTHRLLIHIKERNFQCVICKLKFPLKSTLKKHLLRHQKRENGEKGFNCTLCSMEYRDKSSLQRHFRSKHQGIVETVSCPDCPKKYSSKANLMKHRRIHHRPDVEEGPVVTI